MEPPERSSAYETLRKSTGSYRHMPAATDYYCHFYTLYNWLGNGFYVNNQTGGATAYFYNSGRQVIESAPADGYQRSIDWDPVYYIKNC